jgi:hypothetical protein
LHGNGRMTESPELRAESADLRLLTLVTGRELRLRACLSDGFRPRIGEAHERSGLALDGFRETSIIVRRWFGERASPRITQVPSSRSSRWPTAALLGLLVALVAEDLGAGLAAVAGCIRFRRLDVARRPRPEAPFRPRGSGTSRVPQESVSRCRCPIGRSGRRRCRQGRVLADRE